MLLQQLIIAFWYAFSLRIIERPVLCIGFIRCFFFKECVCLKNVFLLLDCLYGTYGVECRKTCNCKGGICDRETGACLTLPFFAKIASKLKNESQAGKRAKRHSLNPCLNLFAWFQAEFCHWKSAFSGAEVGSGEVQSTDQHTSTPPKRLAPR